MNQNDDFTEDTIDPDFKTIAADGAYVRVLDSHVALMFYRDNVYPKHKSDLFMKFENRERTVLHEVRIPTQGSIRLTTEMDDAISLFQDQAVRRTVGKSSAKAPFLRFNTDDLKEPNLMEIFARVMRIHQLARAAQPVDRVKIKEALDKFLVDNRMLFKTELDDLGTGVGNNV